MAVQIGTTNCSLLSVARKVRRTAVTPATLSTKLLPTAPSASAATMSARRTSMRRRIAYTVTAMIARPMANFIRSRTGLSCLEAAGLAFAADRYGVALAVRRYGELDPFAVAVLLVLFVGNQ